MASTAPAKLRGREEGTQELLALVLALVLALLPLG